VFVFGLSLAIILAKHSRLISDATGVMASLSAGTEGGCWHG
jgi:hypothetical protein